MNELERKIKQLSDYWGIPEQDLIELVKLAMHLVVLKDDKL